MKKDQFYEQHRKLSNRESEMTRLKLLWRDSLTDEERDYWRKQLKSADSQDALRRELLDKYNINLRHNRQLGRFEDWVGEEDAFESEARRVAADWEELTRQGLSGKELRDELLKRMKARALARGDFKLAAQAIKLDLQAEHVSLDERKVVLLERKSKALERAQAEQEEAKKSKGGLTEETIQQIERELNLL